MNKTDILSDEIVGYFINGRVFDKFQAKEGYPIYIDSNEGLMIMRHTLCHILAHALFRIYKDKVSFAIGPATENGGYYLVSGIILSTYDFANITQEMHKIIDENINLKYTELSEKHIIDRMKQKIINDIKDTITVYEQGDFFDICKGPHLTSTGITPKSFKLVTVSEEIWKNEKCQKIRFIAFDTEEKLAKYEEEYRQKEQNDHRKLGKKLNLFTFSDMAPGFAFWQKKGLIIFNKLIELIQKKYKNIYQECKTPIVFKNDLWKCTGHWDKYYENMFVLDDMAIKPMNCPGHALLFNMNKPSYKELPYRIAEFGNVCRKEDQGGVQGLKRTLSFTIDDGHIFCTENQIQSEIEGLLILAEEVYQELNITNTRIKIATRPEQRIGTEEQWNLAEKALIDAMKGRPYIIVEGDGAFYGPKIEIQIQDNMSKWWTCGTIQIDYFLAQRLDVSYMDDKGIEQTPVIIHRAIFGSIERFIGIYTEITKGKFPFFCNPIQFLILPISEKSINYANKIANILDQYRCEVNTKNDTIGKKIKDAKESIKSSVIIIVGQKEEANQTLEIEYNNEKQVIKIENIEQYIHEHI